MMECHDIRFFRGDTLYVVLCIIEDIPVVDDYAVEIFIKKVS